MSKLPKMKNEEITKCSLIQQIVFFFKGKKINQPSTFDQFMIYVAITQIIMLKLKFNI